MVIGWAAAVPALAWPIGVDPVFTRPVFTRAVFARAVFARAIILFGRRAIRRRSLNARLFAVLGPDIPAMLSLRPFFPLFSLLGR